MKPGKHSSISPYATYYITSVDLKTDLMYLSGTIVLKSGILDFIRDFSFFSNGDKNLQYLKTIFLLSLPNANIFTKYEIFQGGANWNTFLLQLQRRKKWKLKSHVKMSWSVVPHPTQSPLLRTVHSFCYIHYCEKRELYLIVCHTLASSVHKQRPLHDRNVAEIYFWSFHHIYTIVVKLTLETM